MIIILLLIYSYGSCMLFLISFDRPYVSRREFFCSFAINFCGSWSVSRLISPLITSRFNYHRRIHSKKRRPVSVSSNSISAWCDTIHSSESNSYRSEILHLFIIRCLLKMHSVNLSVRATEFCDLAMKFSPTVEKFYSPRGYPVRCRMKKNRHAVRITNNIFRANWKPIYFSLLITRTTCFVSGALQFHGYK